MWELDCEESWAPKNWCIWTVVLEKTPESSLDCKEIQPLHSKGDQSWVFFERTDAKAEIPTLWPPLVKSWLIGKDSDVGRDWGQEEERMTEDEMAGWHHRLDEREFEWTPRDGDGQGGLACCDSWGRKESDTTERLKWTEASLSITNSRSSLKLIKLVMPSSHLILGRPLLLLPPIPPSIRVFSNESTLLMRWPNYWSFSFSIIPSKDHPGLISFRMELLDLLAVQGTHKSFLQHHSSKASSLWHSAFFSPTLQWSSSLVNII